MAHRIQSMNNLLGTSKGRHDCFLILHGLRTLRWFTLAESLGGVESLVALPASMTHASMTPEARQRAGITDGVIRLSIGIEDPADLPADLDRSLATIPA
jgi:cystathionine gamma-synthase